MEPLVEYQSVGRLSKDIELLTKLYQITIDRDAAMSLLRMLAKRDRIAVPSVLVAKEAAYLRYIESIRLPADPRVEVVVHEYAHHRMWVKVQRRQERPDLPLHGLDFTRCLDLSAKKVWEILDAG